MYLRTVHAETNIALLRRFIRDNPLGILTTAIPSSTYPLLQSSHIPFLLDVEDEDSDTELGVLRGHVARANPQAKAMIESLKEQDAATGDNDAESLSFLSQEVLILFNAPSHSYVTPKFYTATKPSTGKVVPTWNYAAVQVYGRLRLYHASKSAATDAFLSKQVVDLSEMSERSQMGYTGSDGAPKPWSVDEAPESYVRLLKKAIVGVEITVERMEGKFKMSQEMGREDREGVMGGFEELGTESGRRIADMVRERGEMVEGAKVK